MFSQLSGASRLFPIIGDPVEYAQSPVNLTRTFAERGQTACASHCRYRTETSTSSWQASLPR